MTNLQKLIEEIKRSPLSKEFQDILIKMLPSLADWQIIEIQNIVKDSIKKQEMAFKKAELQWDILRNEFKNELKKLIEEEKKKKAVESLSTLKKNINKNWITSN